MPGGVVAAICKYYTVTAAMCEYCCRDDVQVTVDHAMKHWEERCTLYRSISELFKVLEIWKK